ncbi:type IV pilus biogenesis/stability protein PilW [Pseudoduganella plicata]|uniref:Type IV pilus biogenesis/stability protein PilW n=1 Tax=Pseudoduganella plicata TaxID=321984 RepID=A0A4P7BCA4_9BURK|nr:type IV pilus biogenesis/stability protein PilW [Pseudoduganella plicata]QBQ36144.1 type IV pilus biogenesis/stability protein PilW [Pseudoduganella plicata]GGY77755.1 type IV pilus biogenesis/stability protein PilW [Pseudoduganella plicata]
MVQLAQRTPACLAAFGMAGLLAACAGSGSGDAGGGGKAELPTLSDTTAAQKRAQIRMQLAVGYYEQGQLPVALDEIKKAITADPAYAEAWGVRALIYMAMGETALADANFRHALGLAPGNPDIANNYGSFLCQNGRVAESFRYFDTALASRQYASPAKALNNAGNCALKSKDIGTAEKYLLQALQLTPDQPSTNANLARVYYERRDYARANLFITRLGKLARTDSLPADVLWLAIKVQHKLGDVDAEQGWVTPLRRHHAASPEYAAYQRGAFDE